MATTGQRMPGIAFLAFALALVGCASLTAQGGTAAVAGSAQPRALVMAINAEVSNLSPKAVGDRSPGRTTRVFNADLTIVDAQDNVRPYLAESVPQPNSEAWQVFPDGRMQTTWTLRPGLTWHDGRPLTAEDFVFAFEVYSAPELGGVFSPKPQDIIERVVAVDPRTIRIHWRSPFLYTGDGLTPLPRTHLSESFAAFKQDPAGQSDVFASQRFWTTEYVGAGPYRLTNWEPGSHLGGEAFDGHVLGKPRIDRVVIRIIGDEAAVLANMMAGEAHYSMSQALRFADAMVLRDQGGFNDVARKGKVIFIVASTNLAIFQLRPEYQATGALFDLRVRKAVVHAIDRDAINEGIFEGQAPILNSFVSPTASYNAEIDRVITKYPYDPRKAEQLMIEAGYSRDRDGFFVGASAGRFQPAVQQSAGAQNEKVLAIVADTWQRAGLATELIVMPAALQRDLQARATASGIVIYTLGGTETAVFTGHTSDEIASAANRWNGKNLGGWFDPGFDLLWERYNSTLDRAEQIHAFVQAMKLHSEQVPTFPLHPNLQVLSHVAALKGPEAHTTHWNIHEWEWQ